MLRRHVFWGELLCHRIDDSKVGTIVPCVALNFCKIHDLGNLLFKQDDGAGCARLQEDIVLPR